MPHQQTLIYEFGDFSIDAAKRQLRGRGGEPVPLTTKAFETLLYLVGRAGTVLGNAAIAQMKKAVDLDANFAVAHSTLSVAYWMNGDYAESIEELARFQELTGGERTAALMRESFAKGGWQGFLRAMTDERRPANLTPYNLATFHSALGEKDKAFVELNKAYQNREAILGLLQVDPRFDSLHDDPRFEDLACRFKIAL